MHKVHGEMVLGKLEHAELFFWKLDQDTCKQYVKQYNEGKLHSNFMIYVYFMYRPSTCTHPGRGVHTVWHDGQIWRRNFN